MKNLPLKFRAIMVRRGFVPTVIIVALALIALFGVTALAAWKTSFFDSYLPEKVKDFLGKSISGSPSAVTSDQTSSGSQYSQNEVADLTKDWKTYTNEELGFSFKYPKDWVLYPDVSGGLLWKLGNYIIDITDFPKIEGRVELIYPISPVQLRIIYVSGPHNGDVYLNLEEFGRLVHSGDVGEIYSGSLNYQESWGRMWVKKNTLDGNPPMFYTLGSNGNGYAVYIPEDIDSSVLEIIELVISTLRFF